MSKGMPDDLRPGRVPCEYYECQDGIHDESCHMVDGAVMLLSQDSHTSAPDQLTISIGSISLLSP